MIEKVKLDVDKLLLVLTTRKVLIGFAKIELFLFFKPKVVLSMSAFTFSIISQILETKCYAFWTQTCRNLKSIIFAYMPLRMVLQKSQDFKVFLDFKQALKQ